MKSHVEEIVNATLARVSIPADTARWLGNLQPVLRDKLARLGLVGPVDAEIAAPRIADYIDSFLTKRTDLKESTRSDIRNSGKCLVEFVGSTKRLDEFTKGDASDWLRWMKGKEYADATASRRMGRGSQFFADAVDHDLIVKNPFKGVKVPGMTNKARQYNVDPATMRTLLGSAVGTEWRLVIALARWGGLRIPSELVGLEWSDVRWDEGKFLVPSPKTAHHTNGESRWVPIFPDLLPYLRTAWEAAPDGTTKIISRNMTGQSNLRSKLLWTLRKAGLKPWPRLFQNMRSMRQTELDEQYPSHKVCAWMGNSMLIASKHYLQITEADFRSASGQPIGNAESDARATQNPTTTATDNDRP